MIYRTNLTKEYDRFAVVDVESDYKTGILALDKETASTSPAVSPLGNHVAMGTISGTILIWDLKTMGLVSQLTTGMMRISKVHYCTAERITVSISHYDIENQLWDIKKGQLLQKWKVNEVSANTFWQAETDRQHFTLTEGWLPSPIGDSSASCNILTERDPYLLDVEGGGLWHGNDRLLRLPKEFNPGWSDSTYQSYWPAKAVNMDSIVLGLESGEVVLFKFNNLERLLRK